MPSQITVNSDIEILEVRSYGVITLDEMRANLEALTRLAQQTGFRRVLIDATGEDSVPSPSKIYEIASKVPRNLVVAGYSGVAHEVLDEHRFAETVSVNGGVRGRHFVDRDSALAWLLAQALPGTG